MVEELEPFEGERPDLDTRVIVAPRLGRVRVVDSVVGTLVEPGDVVAYVDDEPVRSPFRGTCMGALAPPGVRLPACAPVVWLTAAAAT